VDDSHIEIQILDTGGGIAIAALPRIFEPFFTTKAFGRGMGLGLSIAYGIIRDMGGSIDAGNIEAGASFTIVLPAFERKQASDAAVRGPLGHAAE